MAKAAFDAIMAGLEDALAYAQGDERRGVAHKVEVTASEVKAARLALGLSQDDFARTFLIRPGTVRNWEQGRRRPEGPASVLLQVIRHEPAAVRRALAASKPAAAKAKAEPGKTPTTRAAGARSVSTKLPPASAAKRKGRAASSSGR